MKFFDTSFLIDIRTKNPNIKPIIAKIDQTGVPATSSIVVHEFLFGGYNSSSVNEISYRKAILNQFRIVPFDGEMADKAAQIEHDLAKQGEAIGRADIIIAATVLGSGSTELYTRNVNHFDKIHDLKIISWKRM